MTQRGNHDSDHFRYLRFHAFQVFILVELGYLESVSYHRFGTHIQFPFAARLD